MRYSKSLWETAKADPASRGLGVLLVVVLATLILGGYALFSLYSELRTERQQSHKRISELSTEVEQYKYALRNVTPDLSASQKETLSKSAQAALLQSKVQVKAACEDLNAKSSNDLELYNFTFWLADIDDVFRHIKSVDYYLDHPSFTQKDLVSTDASTNFKKGYKGWGCLDSVLVKISFDDPTLRAAPIDFNQCKALQSQSCSAH